MFKIPPSRFEADPYGWATNQCGHVVIGVFAMVIGGFFGWGLNLVAIIGCIYFGAIELWLEIRPTPHPERRTFILDSLTDTAFVALGAALVIPMAGSWWAVAVGCLLGVGLSVGAWWRT